jgi:hypothetical protein
MSLAKILEVRKTDNMAEVDREGGVWKDGAFLFPDGSGGSFSCDENYRDAKGILRSRTVFVSNPEDAITSGSQRPGVLPLFRRLV